MDLSETRELGQRHSDEAGRISPAQAPLPRMTSRDLLGALREIEIEHAGRIYRLRLTHSNKLILTA